MSTAGGALANELLFFYVPLTHMRQESIYPNPLLEQALAFTQ